MFGFDKDSQRSAFRGFWGVSLGRLFKGRPGAQPSTLSVHERPRGEEVFSEIFLTWEWGYRPRPVWANLLLRMVVQFSFIRRGAGSEDGDRGSGCGPAEGGIRPCSPDKDKNLQSRRFVFVVK